MAEQLIPTDLSNSDQMFLSELRDHISKLASAHIATEKEYFPYDFMDEIDQLVADNNIDLESEEAQIPDAAKDALYVNLLTEEGLPYYTSTIQRSIPLDHPMREWTHYWTADEGRHAPTISGFLYKTGQFDMRVLERARMAMMKFPDTPQPPSFIEGLIYPAIQEPATEISHRNTMRLLPPAHRVGKRLMGLVVRDEVRHGKFYGSAAEAAIQVEPSLTIIGIAQQVRNFAMPGKSIPGFDEKSKAIEAADIFGLKQLRQIYEELIVERLAVYQQENLSPAAEQALASISKRLEIMDRIIKRRDEQKQVTVSA
ncbi:MAG: acyl-ACP desaturase [bacterium]|nr:acyl-ACP desaturase [bacterium]